MTNDPYYEEVEVSEPLHEATARALALLTDIYNEMNDWYLSLQNTPLMHTARAAQLREIVERWPRALPDVPAEYADVPVTWKELRIHKRRRTEIDRPSRAVRRSNAIVCVGACAHALFERGFPNGARPWGMGAMALRAEFDLIFKTLASIELPVMYQHPKGKGK